MRSQQGHAGCCHHVHSAAANATHHPGEGSLLQVPPRHHPAQEVAAQPLHVAGGFDDDGQPANRGASAAPHALRPLQGTGRQGGSQTRAAVRKQRLEEGGAVAQCTVACVPPATCLVELVLCRLALGHGTPEAPAPSRLLLPPRGWRAGFSGSACLRLRRACRRCPCGPCWLHPRSFHKLRAQSAPAALGQLGARRLHGCCGCCGCRLPLPHCAATAELLLLPLLLLRGPHAVA